MGGYMRRVSPGEFSYVLRMGLGKWNRLAGPQAVCERVVAMR